MLNINSTKHLQKTTEHLQNALKNIQELYESTLTKEGDYCKYLKQIIEIAVDWYEKGNLNYYSFFNKAFPTDVGAIQYYGGLYSFLVNTLLDDSEYKVCWEKYDYKGDFIEGKAWQDLPYVIWTFDGKQHPKEMLDAMLFLIEKDKRREKLYKEWYENQEKFCK